MARLFHFADIFYYYEYTVSKSASASVPFPLSDKICRGAISSSNKLFSTEKVPENQKRRTVLYIWLNKIIYFNSYHIHLSRIWKNQPDIE